MTKHLRIVRSGYGAAPSVGDHVQAPVDSCPEDVALWLNPLMCQELDWLLSFSAAAPDVGKHSYHAYQLREALHQAVLAGRKEQQP